MGIANISGNILTDSGTNLSSLVSGSGTTNYLSKFTGASTIGNSLIFDNGSFVGINGATQLGTSTLSVFGSVAARNGGVDGTYAEAFTAYFSSNNTESNAILSSVSSNGANSGLRFDISNGGGVSNRTTALTLTRSGAIFTNNVSSNTEFRLGNNTYSRVATMDSGGSFGGGYNLNWNNASPVHDSTGSLSGYAYASDGTIRFYTNSSAAANTSAPERLKISADGTLNLGTYHSNAKFLPGADSNHYIRYLTSLDGLEMSGYSGLMFSTLGGTERMKILGNGNITLNNTVYGNTVGSSPRTLYIDSPGGIGGISSVRTSKKNIENVSSVDWIYQLNPVTFNYRKKDENGNYTDEVYEDLNYGLIAEDTAPIADFLINYNDKEDGTKNMVGIEYMRLITPLLKAIQEQKKKIDELSAKVTALENK